MAHKTIGFIPIKLAVLVFLLLAGVAALALVFSGVDFFPQAYTLRSSTTILRGIQKTSPGDTYTGPGRTGLAKTYCQTDDDCNQNSVCQRFFKPVCGLLFRQLLKCSAGKCLPSDQ